MGADLKARIQLSDLLIGAHLVTAEQVAEALSHRGQYGGRLGDRLVAGALTQEALDFLHRMPAEANIAATKIHESELLTLIKLITRAAWKQSANSPTLSSCRITSCWK